MSCSPWPRLIYRPMLNLPLPLILASGSPRRREFMEMLGLPFTIQTADIDETPHPGESPTDLVLRLSRAKGAAVAQQVPHALVIAADTIVVLDDEILGKPSDPADAHRMLRRLNGREHSVMTAVSLQHHQTGRQTTHLSQTLVRMRPYTEPEIAAYVASGDPMDKAGAYAIQNPDFAPVAGLSGCYAGVVGLPLGHLAAGLAEFDIQLEGLADRCAAHTGYPCCLQDSP